MKEFTYYSLIAIVGLVAGFYLGRETIRGKETIRYVKGDTVERLVEVSVPYRVEIPSKPLYIYKTDTLFNTSVQTIDTAAMLSDWITKRSYRQDVFDNENGKLSLDASVQYNQLQWLQYSFTPIEKQVITPVKRVWMPYIEVSYNTLNYVGIGGGVFYHNLGLGVKYTTDFERKGLDFGLKYKF